MIVITKYYKIIVVSLILVGCQRDKLPYVCAINEKQIFAKIEFWDKKKLKISISNLSGCDIFIRDVRPLYFNLTFIDDHKLEIDRNWLFNNLIYLSNTNDTSTYKLVPNVEQVLLDSIVDDFLKRKVSNDFVKVNILGYKSQSRVRFLFLEKNKTYSETLEINSALEHSKIAEILFHYNPNTFGLTKFVDSVGFNFPDQINSYSRFDGELKTNLLMPIM